MDADDYGFGDAWVKAEKEAAISFNQVVEMIYRYGETEDVIDKDRVSRETLIVMMNGMILEIRALRMFLVARFHSEDLY